MDVEASSATAGSGVGVVFPSSGDISEEIIVEGFTNEILEQ